MTAVTIVVAVGCDDHQSVVAEDLSWDTGRVEVTESDASSELVWRLVRVRDTSGENSIGTMVDAISVVRGARSFYGHRARAAWTPLVPSEDNWDFKALAGPPDWTAELCSANEGHNYLGGEGVVIIGLDEALEPGDVLTFHNCSPSRTSAEVSIGALVNGETIDGYDWPGPYWDLPDGPFGDFAWIVLGTVPGAVSEYDGQGYGIPGAYPSWVIPDLVVE